VTQLQSPSPSGNPYEYWLFFLSRPSAATKSWKAGSGRCTSNASTASPCRLAALKRHRPNRRRGYHFPFAYLKSQLSLARVLEHLGLAARLRGSGPQRRCACPIHRADGRGRTFSVNLEENVFHCFDARCGQEGDVIDLWAALHHLDVRAAAIDLVQTFDLEPAPAR
jgi:hypothetical protein